MKTGIFGGTFNPPHLGHRRAVAAAIEKLGLDRVLVIPALTPPHKAMPERSASPAERLEMTRLAFAGMAGVEVSDMELRREGKSYTIDTVLELKTRWPEDKFYLIMGGDMFKTLLTWRRGEELAGSVTSVVLARQNGELESLKARAAELEAQLGAKAVVLEAEITEVSSTELRAAINSGGGFLDEKVLNYIKERGLYTAMRYDFDAFRAYSERNLSGKRFKHVLGCEREAVRLARRWGANEDDARAAALLHDITKELDMSQQLKLCGEYGIMLDTVEKNALKLLHAKTGAALARALFSIPDNVYQAIFWHTTGKANMSLDESVLFMADYVEPTRDFEGVDELRQLAYSDITRAMIRGLELTALEVEERGGQLHIKSVEAMNWLRGLEK